ncbi:MAG: hypothetical protein ACLQPV_03595 [Vulcanimicrobiaceae bacterium]
MDSLRAGLTEVHAGRERLLARLHGGDVAAAICLERVDALVRAQTGALELAAADALQAERDWLGTMRDRRVLERYRDRACGRFEAARKRSEAAEIDDSNARVRNAAVTAR